MATKRAYRVTIKSKDFSYAVEVGADDKTTMKRFGELAIKKIKEEYNVDIPKDAEYDIEFEVVS